MKRVLLLTALLSTCGLFFGELFEQIVFVPNWLIGDVPTNVKNFSAFKHVADPGMFYFPLTIVAIASHVMVLNNKHGLSTVQRKSVIRSLSAFLIVFLLTIYVIVGINVPVFDNRTVADEDLNGLLWQWAILNMIRVVIPAYAIVQLLSLFKVKDN